MSALEMNQPHLQNKSLSQILPEACWRNLSRKARLTGRSEPPGNVFCCPYQFPCAIRQEVPAASVLPLFTTDGQRTRKQIPIDNLLSRAAGNGQCLGLVQAAQSTRGQGLPSCGSLTSLCSLSAETSTMQPVDLSPEEISCPLTSELPVIHQHNPMQKFNMKNG